MDKMAQGEDQGRLEWAQEQLTEAEVPDRVSGTVMSMLETLWTEWGKHEFTEKDVDDVLRHTSALCKGFSIVEDPEDEIWIEAKPGSLVIRDIVRVKSDAYKGNAGIIHNGKEGVIVSMRYGKIRVRYNDFGADSPPFIEHSVQALEKRVR